MADLKKVYAAIDEQTTLYELDAYDENWGSKYPEIAVLWRTNWTNGITYRKIYINTVDFSQEANFPLPT
jgi:transposase-like protein